MRQRLSGKRQKTYTGDHILRQKMRKEGWRMTKAERAAFWTSLPAGELFSTCRLDKRHRRVYGYDNYPIAHSRNYRIMAQDGRLSLVSEAEFQAARGWHTIAKVIDTVGEAEPENFTPDHTERPNS